MGRVRIVVAVVEGEEREQERREAAHASMLIRQFFMMTKHIFPRAVNRGKLEYLDEHRQLLSQSHHPILSSRTMSYKVSNPRRTQDKAGAQADRSNPKVRQLQEMFPSWSDDGTRFSNKDAQEPRFYSILLYRPQIPATRSKL